MTKGDQIDVHIIDVRPVFGFVANQVFPGPALPDALLAAPLAGSASLLQSAGPCPPAGSISSTVKYRPYPCSRDTSV